MEELARKLRSLSSKPHTCCPDGRKTVSLWYVPQDLPRNEMCFPEQLEELTNSERTEELQPVLNEPCFQGTEELQQPTFLDSC